MIGGYGTNSADKDGPNLVFSTRKTDIERVLMSRVPKFSCRFILFSEPFPVEVSKPKPQSDRIHWISRLSQQPHAR